MSQILKSVFTYNLLILQWHPLNHISCWLFRVSSKSPRVLLQSRSLSLYLSVSCPVPPRDGFRPQQLLRERAADDAVANKTQQLCLVKKIPIFLKYLNSSPSLTAKPFKVVTTLLLNFLYFRDGIHQIVSRFLERFRYMCPLLFSCVFPS
jgi:hypothetical protein